jgi:sugar lactone lactonase YvrE
MQSIYLLICLVLGLGGCARLSNESVNRPELLAVIQERDLIPEGTAYDSVTQQVFISSMYKRKIVGIRKDGSTYNYIKEAQDSIWGTLGMEVDAPRRKLWVISSKGEAGIVTRLKPPDGTWDTKLYCYNIDSGFLDRTYSIVSSVTKGYCFNDLTITRNGDVYITESITNKIFLLPADEDSIGVFLAPQRYSFLNGITLSSDEKVLFVSSSEGLLRIDLNNKAIKPISYVYTIDPNPIDGLTYYQESLIGHQSTVLTRFYLNHALDSILHHENIDNIGLNSSTTGELGNEGLYYYIANSQISSGVDYAHQKIIPWDSLQPIEIRKIRL